MSGPEQLQQVERFVPNFFFFGQFLFQDSTKSGQHKVQDRSWHITVFVRYA